MVTAIGGDAWTADQIAGIASRQTQDRREFRLHDTRRRHNDRWRDSVDLDWFLNEYEILQRIWPVGTPLEADLWTEHGQSPPGAAAPHDTAAQGADEPPSTSSAEMAEAGPIDDGAIPDASAHHTHTQAGHKRPRHGASDARCAISDLTRDTDETTQAIVRHELEATGATATAAQPQGDDAPTSPAAEQLRDPRCPQHEQLFTGMCHYYADKQHPRRPMPDAIQMTRRMARE
jgi:hypothetical protein